MVNNVTQRLVYENAKSQVIRAFGPNYNEDQIRMTQSYLRLEAPMVAGKTSYNFLVQANQGNPFNTEKRLNLQDSFVISEVGIYVAKPSSATDAKYPLLTFPDPTVFSSGTTAADLEALYNAGEMQILVDNVQYVPAWDVQKHKFIGQTQASMVASPQTAHNQYDGSTNGMYPMEPNLILVGSKNNVVNITLPNGIDTVETNSRIIIIYRGLLVQNSTTVR